MVYIITRMPTTGQITHVATSTDPIEEVQKRCADCPYVEVTEEEPTERNQ